MFDLLSIMFIFFTFDTCRVGNNNRHTIPSICSVENDTNISGWQSYNYIYSCATEIDNYNLHIDIFLVTRTHFIVIQNLNLVCNWKMFSIVTNRSIFELDSFSFFYPWNNKMFHYYFLTSHLKRNVLREQMITIQPCSTNVL